MAIAIWGSIADKRNKGCSSALPQGKKNPAIGRLDLDCI
jgi:hypothetical protein